MPQEKKRKVASAQDGKPSSSSTSSAEAGAVGADWEWSGKLVQNFLLTASPDLRQVWEMALSVSPKDPCAAFKSVGVTLCGPFDMMAGRRKRDGLPWSLHSRHRYDPPEVVTVALLDDGRRWCYHRDSPEEEPHAVVASVPDTKHKRGRFDLIAPTLIHALAEHSKAQLKGLKGADRSVAETIVERTSAAAAESTRDSGSDAKGRKRATTKRVPIDTTLSGLGIVVPYDKKTEVGWRELSVSDSELQRYFESLLVAKEAGRDPDFAELDRLITFANIANDECDYGQALKLGLDMFTMVELDGDTKHLLVPTYRLLGRDRFAELMEQHTADDRRRGDDTSVLE